ncbi:tRNA (adenosine(37)-N6)-threonylcarbamoyltransferase complex dimerization subunit type 1 TsaB [Virgibacillus sp. W0430]|uniref:tRNA (adenosine(37)-N6)-threonylcarbamoyltransferase complex dimerization subunit type 1 TsaB n=1 Tax=Virgibacillus sp. W0430 TaxID=3391580 RepID=UPI003F489AA3
MNVLAIDTSNEVLALALLQNEELIGQLSTKVNRNHSIRLMPAVVSLMQKIEMKPEELDKIIVAKGPGSYTGVRIGVTTAKSLAWALKIPVVGVSSLEALAYQGLLANRYICPFFDARRQTVFTGLYKWEEHRMKLVYEETNMPMKNWLSKLIEINQPILFLSPHLASFKEMIIQYMGENAIIPKSPYHVTNATHVALAGLEKEPEDVHSLTPNYLRMAEAEANWLKAQKDVQ